MAKGTTPSTGMPLCAASGLICGDPHMGQTVAVPSAGRKNSAPQVSQCRAVSPFSSIRLPSRARYSPKSYSSTKSLPGVTSCTPPQEAQRNCCASGSKTIFPPQVGHRSATLVCSVAAITYLPRRAFSAARSASTVAETSAAFSLYFSSSFLMSILSASSSFRATLASTESMRF